MLERTSILIWQKYSCLGMIFACQLFASIPESSAENLETSVAAKPGTVQLMQDVLDIPFSHNTLSDSYIKQIQQGRIDLRKFAASLVERKRLFQERWGNNQTEKAAAGSKFISSLDNVELLSFFSEQYFDAFLKNGQLNVHQTGHSRGMCDPLVRARAEDFMIGIHLESRYEANKNSRLNYLRPKYGCLNFLSPTEVYVNPNRILRYGQIILVYKDEVKLRSTYTYGDSLVSYCEPWEKCMHPIEPVALTNLEPPQKDYRRIRYVEAQIWGPLDLSDIKEFRVPKQRVDLVEKLSLATGLPVYAYDRDSMELCDQFVEESKAGLAKLEPLNAAAKSEQAKKAALITK